MQVEEITQILRESPSVRLIKSRSVDFFLSFVIEAFEGQAAIMQERLHMLLENRLDEQENTLVEDDSEMTRLVESNEQKAKRLIKDWTDKGFLTNYQNEEGEVIYEISSHTSKLIDWVVSLKKEDYIGTESKFKTLFSQLKELVEYSNEDREKRLELLRTKKMEIEHQIQRLEMGEEVEVYEDYQIEPRYNSLNKLAKELLSDFKEVDDNFKGIIKEIYERQTENAEKKALLNYIFDAYGELKQSQQGKSFYAFWEFLLSADLQKEWDELTGVLYKTLENRGIDAHDMFLKEMKKHLFDAGEKVAKTNDRMSEKLSRIIRQNGHMNAEATKQVINDIKKLLIEASRRKEKPDASLEYETIDINLPLERPLTLRDQDEGYNQYAFSFLLLFVDDNNYYNIGEIVKGVKNMDIYESFFMKEVSGMMDRSDMDVSVTEEIKIRVVKWAKASVLKLSDGEPIFFWREALGLMLKGEFEIPSEKLLSLLCFGSYTISRKDFDEYYSREYSLFEYITERVDSVTLAPKVIEKLRANIDNAEYPLLYSFSNIS